MQPTYYYLLLSGVLTLLLWTPYILSRAISWGIPQFLHNYPEDFPREVPEQPLWAVRAQRVHLNMVETMPAFIAVVIAAGFLDMSADHTVDVASVSTWAGVFFWARVAYSTVYILAVPYLRTPVYLVSWLSILMIAISVL